MLEAEFFQTDLFTFYLLPLFIFLSRIADVSIGTLRIIFVSKGNKLVSPILGFFEVLIWVVAITRIIENLDNFACYIAYAGGFAAGNYVGLLIEEKLALGKMIIRIIIPRNSEWIIEKLNNAGYGTTTVKAEGSKEKVSVVYSIFDRNDLLKIISIIKSEVPKAFYSIEDVRMVSKGVFPFHNTTAERMQLFRRWRRGK